MDSYVPGAMKELATRSRVMHEMNRIYASPVGGLRWMSWRLRVHFPDRRMTDVAFGAFMTGNNALVVGILEIRLITHFMDVLKSAIPSDHVEPHHRQGPHHQEAADQALENPRRRRKRIHHEGNHPQEKKTGGPAKST